MKHTLHLQLRLVFGAGLMLFLFQNCQPATSGDRGDLESPSQLNALECPAPWDSSLLILNGESVEAYSSDSVVEGMQCQKELRVCTEGQLSGSFNSKSCQVLPLAAKDCAVPWAGGVPVKDGASVKAYQVVGGVCQEEVRQCVGGKLGGSFQLEKCPVSAAKDTYKGYFVVKGKSSLFVESKNITETAALANCKLNADNNPTKGIKCLWGAKVILQKDEPIVSPEKKECKVYFASGASAATRVSDQSACLQYFQEVKKNNPKALFSKVQFDGRIILIIELPPPVKTDIFKGYFIKKGISSLFIETKDITEAAALASCTKNASANPTYGVKCTWGSKVILHKSEPMLPPPAKKICAVHFKSGAVVSSKVADKAACQAYFREIKKNNPRAKFSKVLFDGKDIM